MNKRQRRLFYRRNKKLLLSIGVLLVWLIILLLCWRVQGTAQTEIISPLPDPTPTLQPTLQPTPVTLQPTPLYEGKVSYYSHAGCLGCSENQTMGNGELFDEEAMTIAIPCEDIRARKHRYNTSVMITNIDTGKAVQARITDCGGFSKYNRVADVSLGIYKLLGIKTDRTNIRIEKI